jgi:hypothetical protein
MTVDGVTHMPGREINLPNRHDPTSRTRTERKAERKAAQNNRKLAGKLQKKARRAAEMGINTGPARAIIQEIPGQPGHHQFMGVVAHDQSRIKDKLGYNDHFQIHPS